MILIDFALVRSGVANMRASDWNQIAKGAYIEAGEHWHKHFRALHFTPSGARKYGYAPRAGENLPFMSKRWRRSYAGRKWLKHHHRNPLVLTGESRARTERLDVRGTRNRASVYLHAPALNFRNPHSQVNMRQEMLTVTSDEVDAMTRAAQRQLDRDVAAFRRTKRTKIRSG
jgi:hypothetical protein